MGKIELTDFFNMSPEHPLYDYIREKLIVEGKTPDKGSEFFKRTEKYGHLPNKKYLIAMEKEGYDVLVIHEDMSDEESYLHGYIAYQIEEGKAGIFKRVVDEEVRGNRDLTRKLIEETLSHLKSKGARKINFDSDSEELIDFLKTKEDELNIAVNTKTRSLSFLSVA